MIFEDKQKTVKEIDVSVSELPEFQARQIKKAPQEAITAPTGGATIDAEARTAINSLISRLQNLGLIR